MLVANRLCSVRAVNPLRQYLPSALRAVEGRVAGARIANNKVRLASKRD